MNGEETALAQWRREVEDMQRRADAAAGELVTARARLSRAQRMVRRLEGQVSAS